VSSRRGASADDLRCSLTLTLSHGEAWSCEVSIRCFGPLEFVRTAPLDSQGI
jgi:hypothetical protein